MSRWKVAPDPVLRDVNQIQNINHKHIIHTKFLKLLLHWQICEINKLSHSLNNKYSKIWKFITPHLTWQMHQKYTLYTQYSDMFICVFVNTSLQQYFKGWHSRLMLHSSAHLYLNYNKSSPTTSSCYNINQLICDFKKMVVYFYFFLFLLIEQNCLALDETCVLMIGNFCRTCSGGIYWSSQSLFPDCVTQSRNQTHSRVIKLYSV